MLENFINNLETFNEIDYIRTFLSLICCIILSFALKYLYIEKSISLSNKSHIANVLPMLSLITFLVILIVKSSLALSLGLVGALSIVRFRAAIKEPEELVYLFFVISIGLANGANQFLLSSFATIAIVSFLFARNILELKYKKNSQFSFVLDQVSLANFQIEYLNVISEQSYSFNTDRTLLSATLPPPLII